MKRHKEGYNARLDESLGMRHPGASKQSYAGRRHESEGMEKHYGDRKFSGDASMDEKSKKAHHHSMAAAHHRFMARHHAKKGHKR